MTIYTFGYGNRKTYYDLINHIELKEIKHIIDVRRMPYGWNAVWSYSELERFAKKHNINYESKKELGNSGHSIKWIPASPRKAEEALNELAVLAKKETILLMCAELDYKRCHRTEVANKLSEMTGLPVEHLL